MHNKDVIAEKETRAVNCKCINKPDYHLSNQFQITSIIYETKITSNFRKYHEKLYQVHLNSDMETLRNHSIMKNVGQIQNFKKNSGDLRNSKHNLKYNFIF